MQSYISVGFSLPRKIMEKIDVERGDISRSRYLLRLLERVYLPNDEEHLKGRGAKTELNMELCEAEGCFSVAEEEIRVPVGKLGEISLAVCNNCKFKFIHQDLDDNQGKVPFRKIANSGSVSRRDQSLADQITPFLRRSGVND